MKPRRLHYTILAAGIFILIFSTLSGAAILTKFYETCGEYGAGKVSAELLDDHDPEGGSALTLEDIRHLQQFTFRGLDIAYGSEGKTAAGYEGKQAQAGVYGVSDSFNRFHRLELKSGSFITQGNKGEMVAVVDEDLAVELFNNTGVVGMYLELYGRRFRIIGVTASDSSVVQSLTEDGRGMAYIPVEQMLEYSAGSDITALELRAEDMGTTSININKMKEGLASIGKNPVDYRIVDYNIEKKLMEEKIQGVIFIAGTGIIIMLLFAIKKRLIEIYVTIKTAFKQYYFRDVIRHQLIKPCLILLEAAAALALIFVVWNAVKFSVYIPAEYIPEELIDLEFYRELFTSLMQKRVQSAGYIPSTMEMTAYVLSILQTWNFAVGVFAGFPVYFLGLRLLEPTQPEPMKQLLYSSAFVAISIALSLLILTMLNMPVAVDTKGLLIMAAFILLPVPKPEQSL